MNFTLLARVAGSILLLIAALFIALGGKALWNGRPGDWPDLTATDQVVIAASRWAIVIASLLAVCAIAALANARWAFIVTSIALVALLIVLFWGHFVLFGTWDAKHAATNIVIAAIIWALLWKGTGKV